MARTSAANIRNTTAKERMLKGIRQALLHKRPDPFPDFEDAPLYQEEKDPIDFLFARELTRVGGHFEYCEGEIALVESLITLVEELRVTKLAVWENGLQRFLDQYGFPFANQRHDISDIEVGITSCEYLVARSGSVLISNSSESGRTLSVVPPIHLVIAMASQIVPDIKDAFAGIQQKYGENIPSTLSLITGSSRTKLFGHQFSEGGIGTQKRYVFVLEDRF